MSYRPIKKLSPVGGVISPKKGEEWSILIHNGVLFPPSYEPLPSNIKVLYKGSPVDLDKKNTRNKFNITAEEAAVFFAMKMEQDDRLAEENKSRVKAVDDPKFMANFWNDWKVILGQGHVIKSIKDVDFRPVQRFIASRSEQKKLSKKQLTKEEKKAEKEEKEAIKDLYGYAIVDNRLIPLGNYMVQPPGLFIGHPGSPLIGKIKKRVEPSDIILNLSKKYLPPECQNNGSPCKWGEIVERHDVTWIAAYKHPITEEMNYVYLKREASHWVHADDLEKFEKARKLGENIDRVRAAYSKNLTSSNNNIKQLATAVYLLDTLAIRPGTEKDEAKEAGTQGLTTLKCGNIKFLKSNQISIEFIGKSSILFTKTFEVKKVVYDNLQELCKSTKGKDKKIFPDINDVSLNDYLKTLLPGLTAKVFRTYKASSILQENLFANIPAADEPLHTKKLMYDRVNIEVAKILNHKKMGGSDKKITKLEEKIADLRQKKTEATTAAKKAAAQKSIEIAEAKLEEAENNISTSTSKVNYMDPRITVVWCKLAEMPIEKIYNKTSLNKFVWSMTTGSKWRF